MATTPLDQITDSEQRIEALEEALRKTPGLEWVRLALTPEGTTGTCMRCSAAPDYIVIGPDFRFCFTHLYALTTTGELTEDSHGVSFQE
jgi:hypothetical protein